MQKFFRALAIGVVITCLSCSTGPSRAPAGNADEPAVCGGELPGFRHGSADVDGARLHYVMGGRGPAVVLIHGFPETWWTWRQVMPLLSRHFTVIAVDLRGVGCSSITPAVYDSQTLATDIHEVVRSLNLTQVAVVGHDTGGWVAYGYARQYRDQVTDLVLSGAAIPGFGLERLLDFREPGQGLPHLPFFMQPAIPESLIGGREQQYFSAFITSETMKHSGATEYYASSYSRPGRLTAALGQYRALYRDAEDNRRGAGPLLTMPTAALGGTDEIALSADSLHQVAGDVREIAVPGAGHYVQEDSSVEFANALTKFLDGSGA